MTGPAIDGFQLIDPQSFEEAGFPHEVWRVLRASSPGEREEP